MDDLKILRMPIVADADQKLPEFVVGNGFPVLTPEGEPVKGLVPGQKVQVMHLIGRVWATVRSIESDGTTALAEDQHNLYPLHLVGGQWVGDSACSKAAMRLMKFPDDP